MPEAADETDDASCIACCVLVEHRCVTDVHCELHDSVNNQHGHASDVHDARVDDIANACTVRQW